MANNSRSTPWSRAAAMACRNPRVCAVIGRSGSSRVIPLVAASSTTAVRSGSSSQWVLTGRSSGPVTVTGIKAQPG